MGFDVQANLSAAFTRFAGKFLRVNVPRSKRLVVAVISRSPSVRSRAARISCVLVPQRCCMCGMLDG